MTPVFSNVSATRDASRPDIQAALLVDDGVLLLKHSGRYEAAVFLRAHAVPLRIIARVVWSLGRRRRASRPSTASPANNVA